MFEKFYENYQQAALRSLISEGLLETLQNSVNKYSWKRLDPTLSSILSLMIKVDPQTLTDLFKVEKIYLNIIKNILFQEKAKQIALKSSEKDRKILENICELIVTKK